MKFDYLADTGQLEFTEVSLCYELQKTHQNHIFFSLKSI